MQKRWNIGARDENVGAVREISAVLGIEYVTALLLYKRGYRTPKEAENFIKLGSELFYDPFLLADMEKACRRIISALDGGEKIVIYGDYDVDGVTSVSMMYLYLKSNGADVEYYVPNRLSEGYGINTEAIKKLADDGAKLFITVDTGITATDETEYVKWLGCDMIITDHHECHGELPDAVAVINPKRADSVYPFKELAGVGVAFKVITALEFMLCERNGRKKEDVLSYVCGEYIDLVTLGTVADVMPLKDENRLIVRMGLERIEKSARPGIRALCEAADGGKSKQPKKVTSSLIGFTLAPRINAAGRIGSATRAVELFITGSQEEASVIASELCEMNRVRQTEENKIIEQIKSSVGEGMESDRVIVLDSDEWHLGIIGIAASKVTEKSNRPSILISFDGDVGKGSGRSIKGLNLVDALTYCSDLLIKYGGHELAAGLSIERDKLPEFRRRINEYASTHLTEDDMVTNVDVDCELDVGDITLKQADELSVLEPFGVSNPVPVFAMSGLTVVEAIGIGSNRHSKYILEKGGKRFTAVYFGSSPDELGYIKGDTVDAVFNLNVNEFMNVRSEQLLLQDIRFAKEQAKKLDAERAEYERIVSGGYCADRDTPKREYLASVYLRLKRRFSADPGELCLNRLLGELNDMPGQSGMTDHVGLRLALDILSEIGTITLVPTETETPGLEKFTVTINDLEKKVSLEKSCLYKRLTESAKTTTPV